MANRDYAAAHGIMRRDVEEVFPGRDDAELKSEPRERPDLRECKLKGAIGCAPHWTPCPSTHSVWNRSPD